MKKNISINISGIIFHIEEDGYESLRKYLDSISKYFSTFEDSSEIMADIESRIAEIFLSKLNEGKQVITLDDVSTLIATMGSVSDFKAAEETSEPASNSGTAGSASTPTQDKDKANTAFTPPKQLRRDQKRKILGGVCAGIGNYFNIDPVWVRLLFALMAFAYGIALVVYLIMWVVIPGSFDLDEPQIDKKLFRDPEGKVLGGVSGGLASYFGTDIILIRVLFIALAFAGGFGVLMYIVLWASLPEARSLTDRIQMQGEPVTLSNIESNIKKNLNVEGEKEESTLTKIVLFPFRVIGTLLGALGKILVPLVDVLRVAIGILITLVGFALAFAVLVSGAVLLGLFTSGAFSWGEFTHISFPFELISSTFPGWLALFAFIGALVPTIFIILLGISVISQRIVFGPVVGWTLFVTFFVCAALLSASIPKIAINFKEDGTHKIESLYTPTTKRIALRLNETGLDDYHAVDLTIKGYDGKDIKLVQEFKAQGPTRQQAVENAQMVTYLINVQDSVFTFDSNLAFKENAQFRAQRLEITLYVPYDYPFTMTRDVGTFVTNYVDYDYLDGHVWRMIPEGLDCLSCPVADGDPETREGKSESFGLVDFDEIELNGFFDVEIKHGENYLIELAGPEKSKELYSVEREGETLIIGFKDKDRFFWQHNLNDYDRVRIKITMPSLERVEAQGAGEISFEDFETNDLSLELLGAIKLDGSLNANDVTINISGASKVDLAGKTKHLDAVVQGTSALHAFDLESRNASVEVNGPSKAEVNVTGTLEINEGLVSDIEYHGNPKVIKRD